MPIPNSDYVPRESFPGVATGAETTNAPGSAGASGRPADSVDGGQVSLPCWGPGRPAPGTTAARRPP
jgi:hypothetical protein